MSDDELDESEEETEDQDLNEVVQTIRRDPRDGELIHIDDHDELQQVHYFRSIDGTENGEWLDVDEVVDLWRDHVIGMFEVWRTRPDVSVDDKKPNPIFIGADVVVTSVNLKWVTFSHIHLPLARDSKAAVDCLAPESESLEMFLKRFEHMAENKETWQNVPAYAPSAADRKGVEAVRADVRGRLQRGDVPPDDTAKFLIASGLADAEEIAKAKTVQKGNPIKAVAKLLEDLLGQPATSPNEQKNNEVAESLGLENADGSDNDTQGETHMVDFGDDGSGKVKKLKVDDFKGVKLKREGAQIVLPEGMTTRVGIEWLTRMDKEDERTVRLHHEIQAYPIEGAYALYRALKDKYGFTSLQSTPSFFGEDPPRMVGLDISRTEHVQVPWGRMAIPGVAGFLETSATLKNTGEIRFVLSGEVKRRDEEEANSLINLVREYATARSIYKGKAIRVKFPAAKDDFDFTYLPEFIDTSKVREKELVFPREVAELVDVTLFSPIEKTALCRSLQIPLKRGILLEGPYGVGKTLTAYVTAKKCEENGWTFMYLDKTTDLKKAIMLARNYQPCVIFAEDIDRAMEGGDRTSAMDEILNTIDGIDGKSSEILVVLTTNHVEEINRAMLRPGRLDAVIPVRAPDAGAATTLVRNYARGLLKATDEEMVPVGEALQGLIPAVIREAVERAKLAAIVRLDRSATELDLRPEDLLKATTSMKAQLALMQQPIPDTREPIEKAADTLARAIGSFGTGPVEPTVAVNGKGSTRQQVASTPEA